MKKRVMLIIMVFLTLSLSTPAFAIEILYKNKPISMDVPPMIVNDRILVPIRAINDALNGETSWDQINQEVTLKKDGTIVILKIGDRNAYVNGEKVELDVPAQAKSNRTFVPLRFVSQHFGHKVVWDGPSKTVLIDSSKPGDGIFGIVDNSINDDEIGEFINDDEIDEFIIDDVINDFIIRNNIDDIIDGVDYTKIYEVNGTGANAGYKRLMGYPDADKYAIYYEGSANSFHAKYEILNSKSLQEKIKWKHEGKTYTNTRAELYSFFSDIITLESILGKSSGIINQYWLAQTFGSTYEEWILNQIYFQDGYRIVSRYLSRK